MLFCFLFIYIYFTVLNATDYGYVRYQNGEFYLHFEGADSSMPKSMGYICQEGKKCS